MCVGHTHQPYVLEVGDKLVINPGSVGLPRDGDPRASYAVIENYKVDLKRVEYPVEDAAAVIQASALPDAAKEMLAEIVRTGAPLNGRPTAGTFGQRPGRRRRAAGRLIPNRGDPFPARIPARGRGSACHRNLDNSPVRPRRLLKRLSPALLLFCLSAGCVEQAAPEPPSLRFEVTIADGLTTEPQDGRLLMLIGRKTNQEPRLSIDPEDVKSPAVLGRDVKGLAPGVAVRRRWDGRHVSVERLSQLPKGDYVVQAVLDVNRALKLIDAPGNLLQRAAGRDARPGQRRRGPDRADAPIAAGKARRMRRNMSSSCGCGPSC